MAESSDQAFVLKHRLVGAAVLVLIGIIVLPQILTGTNRRVAAPSGFQQAILPKVQQAFVSRITISNNEGEDSNPTAPKNGQATSKEKAPASANADPKTASNKALALDDQPAGWVVRVGVFHDAGNVRKRFSLLVENGFDVRTENTELAGRRATRVYIGPYPNQAEADRQRARVVMVINDRAFVVRYP